MEKEIYLNFAVYNKDGIDYIVNVMDGYAASDAWKISDEAYNKIAGRSFFGLFGDDGKCVCCDKGQVRRITSKEEYGISASLSPKCDNNTTYSAPFSKHSSTVS